MLEGKNADINRVQESLPSASLIHIACHSTYESQNLSKSGIELAHGQRLTLSKLTAGTGYLKHARLVFLSSCESGLSGSWFLADEFIGLPVSFLQAGAKGVIGTLWPVFDDAAMLICDKFYEYYLDEEGLEKVAPAEALAKAQYWLCNVSLKELQNSKFGSVLGFDKPKQNKIQQKMRLRLNSKSKFQESERQENHSSEKEIQVIAFSSDSIRPYASPIEWAGFVLVGL